MAAGDTRRHPDVGTGDKIAALARDYWHASDLPDCAPDDRGRSESSKRGLRHVYFQAKLCAWANRLWRHAVGARAHHRTGPINRTDCLSRRQALSFPEGWRMTAAWRARLRNGATHAILFAVLIVWMIPQA